MTANKLAAATHVVIGIAISLVAENEAWAELPPGANYYAWSSPNTPTPMFDYTQGYCFLTTISISPPSANGTNETAYIQGAQNPNPPYELRWELTGGGSGLSASAEALCVPWSTLNPGGSSQEGQFTFGNWFTNNSPDYAFGNGEICSMGGMGAFYEAGGAPIWQMYLPTTTAGNCGTPCDYGVFIQNGYPPVDTLDVNCVRPYGTTERFANVTPGGDSNPLTTLFSVGSFESGFAPTAASSICAIQNVYPNEGAHSFEVSIVDSGAGPSSTWQLNLTNAEGEMDCVHLPMH